jgi:hypothetical protein
MKTDEARKNSNYNIKSKMKEKTGPRKTDMHGPYKQTEISNKKSRKGGRIKCTIRPDQRNGRRDGAAHCDTSGETDTQLW